MAPNPLESIIDRTFAYRMLGLFIPYLVFGSLSLDDHRDVYADLI